jgi:hypothetical protein
MLTGVEPEIALSYLIGSLFVKFTPLFGKIMKNLKMLKDIHSSLNFNFWISFLDKLTIIEFSDEM